MGVLTYWEYGPGVESVQPSLPRGPSRNLPSVGSVECDDGTTGTRYLQGGGGRTTEPVYPKLNRGYKVFQKGRGGLVRGTGDQGVSRVRCETLSCVA